MIDWARIGFFSEALMAGGRAGGRVCGDSGATQRAQPERPERQNRTSREGNETKQDKTKPPAR